MRYCLIVLQKNSSVIETDSQRHRTLITYRRSCVLVSYFFYTVFRISGWLTQKRGLWCTWTTWSYFEAYKMVMRSLTTKATGSRSSRGSAAPHLKAIMSHRFWFPASSRNTQTSLSLSLFLWFSPSPFLHFPSWLLLSRLTAARAHGAGTSWKPKHFPQTSWTVWKHKVI